MFGDLLSLAAGLAWALTNIVIKRAPSSPHARAEKLLLYQLAGAAIVGRHRLPFGGRPSATPRALGRCDPAVELSSLP